MNRRSFLGTVSTGLVGLLAMPELRFNKVVAAGKSNLQSVIRVVFENGEFVTFTDVPCHYEQNVKRIRVQWEPFTVKNCKVSSPVKQIEIDMKIFGPGGPTKTFISRVTTPTVPNGGDITADNLAVELWN